MGGDTCSPGTPGSPSSPAWGLPRRRRALGTVAVARTTPPRPTPQLPRAEIHLSPGHLSVPARPLPRPLQEGGGGAGPEEEPPPRAGPGGPWEFPKDAELGEGEAGLTPGSAWGQGHRVRGDPVCPANGGGGAGAEGKWGEEVLTQGQPPPRSPPWTPSSLPAAGTEQECGWGDGRG